MANEASRVAGVEYAPPTFGTSEALRAHLQGRRSHWQDLGSGDLQRRPDADQWPDAPPAPTREEIRRAIATLENARFHSGWVDFHRPNEAALVAASWGIEEAELVDLQRLCGWGSAALREAYIMTYVD